MDNSNLLDNFDYKVKIIPLNKNRRKGEYYFLKKPSRNEVLKVIKDLLKFKQ